jgi:hypothetical protein
VRPGTGGDAAGRVIAKTIEPTPTAVVAAAATWAEVPAMWRPMLDKVWSFLRGGAPEGLYKQGHNIILYKDDVPSIEVGVQVSGSFEPAGDVVPSALPGGLIATATHTGPIALIGDTHREVREWSKAMGYRLAGPRWEIYGDPDPSTGDFDVDVFWSLVAPLPGTSGAVYPAPCARQRAMPGRGYEGGHRR